MRTQKQLDRWAKRQIRRGAQITRWKDAIGKKNRFLGAAFRLFLRLFEKDFANDVSSRLLGLAGVAMILSVAIGVEGWTTGREVKLMLAGAILVGGAALAQRARDRALLDLYRYMHGGRTEWSRTAFDIRDEWLDSIHAKLNVVLPGVQVFGRYDRRGDRDRETGRTPVGVERRWENRHGKRLCAVCFEWREEKKEFRVEYRRPAAGLYASKFVQTKGVDVPWPQ